ncbi:C3 and PZP-like alpha-2-macroglobulin domain-containing protein 8 [Patiria miniata]|uniref:Farnesoic acid O-methyl transferase domain-containing protein n=1 Tax=Patiria miniata TaxID=46514 RepID=A0A914AA60_PATMI|nr:C3 and PZP-like alpha-2-macroglobulin domain-containing protein 8 [Patiria miniata]
MQPCSVSKTIFFATVTLILSVFDSYAITSETLPGTRRADAILGDPDDTIFSGHAYRRIVGKSRLHCGATCAGNATGCLSFNYCHDTKVCELNSAGAAQHRQDLIHAEGCNYYDTSTRSVCGMVTDTTYYYRYLPSAVDVRRLEFWVQASHDAHVSLSPALPADPDELYEIVFGSGFNQWADIRRCALCPSEVDVPAPGVVSGSQFRGFWVTFDLHTGLLAAGREGQVTPIMQWVDPAPLDVKYVGFSTGWGSTGIFRYSCSM